MLCRLDVQKMSSRRKSRKKKSRSPHPFTKLPSKTEVEAWVRNDDRWTLLKHFMTRVPQGTRRFADVDNVGPVVDDCDMESVEIHISILP